MSALAAHAEPLNGRQFMDDHADAATIIRQMKRTAKVETDGDLAAALGLSPTAISNWRKRGAVPERALLRFEFRFSEIGL